METIVIKISSSTVPTAAAKSIAGYTLAGKKVYIDAIGYCNYIAAKALVKSKAYLSERGISVSFSPFYVDLMMPSNVERTGIRWEVIIK